MRDLFTSRFALAAAWVLVVVGLAAGLTIALLQPRPPASGNAVTMVVIVDPPAAQSAGSDTAPAPSEEPAAEGQAAENETAEQPASELPSAALELPAAEPEDHGTGEPQTPDPTASLALPPEAPSEAPAEGGTEAQGETTEAHGETGTQGATEAPAEASHAEDPAAPAKPEADVSAVVALPPAGDPAPEAGQDTGQDGGQDGGHGDAQEDSQAAPAAEQQAAIPSIPPAPEQLPTWERFRQPFDLDDKRPRIAVVLTGLGLSDSATEAAINQLPPAVTLSFSPYARGLERWIALARARGHEVMLDLPMEPATFPNEDPGPQGLLVGLPPEENLNRLAWVLSRGSAYVGLAGAMGSRFTASRKSVEPVLREVNDRGLMFLDRRTTESSLVPQLASEIGLPTAINNRSVDERQASRVAIDARLAQIERIALTEGFAVAMAQPYPVTLDRLAEWSTEITSRGFALAPISALAGRQKAP